MRTMKAALALALALSACNKSKPPPPPNGAALVQTMHDFAERAYACNGEKDCLLGIREEFDTQKRQLLPDGARLTGADKEAFDADLVRLRGYGDAGGVTIWLEL